MNTAARASSALAVLCLLALPVIAHAEDQPLDPDAPFVSDELMVELTADDVVLRSGPGQEFAVVGFHEKGERFAVLAKKGDWYDVRIDTVRTGWVHATLCREFHDLSGLEFRPNPRLFSRVGSFALTGFGGAYSFDRKSNALLLGGRVSYFLFEYVDVEGTVGWSRIVRPAEIVESLFDLELAEEDFHMLFYALNVNLKLLPGRQLVPYLTFGAGSTIMQGETESGLNFGGGTTMYVHRRVAIRWEVRAHRFRSGLGEARDDNDNLEFSMGTSVLF